MLGVFDALRVPCDPTRSSLGAGDRILLITDGLIEVRNAEGDTLGLDRLRACVVEHAGLLGKAFNEAVFAAALAHGAGGLEDDALLVSARRR